MQTALRRSRRRPLRHARYDGAAGACGCSRRSWARYVLHRRRRAYAPSHEHEAQDVVTDDLRASLEAVSCRDLRPWFAEWIEGTGFPSVQVHVDDDGRAPRLVAHQAQTAEQGHPVFHFPVQVQWVPRRDRARRAARRRRPRASSCRWTATARWTGLRFGRPVRRAGRHRSAAVRGCLAPPAPRRARRRDPARRPRNGSRSIRRWPSAISRRWSRRPRPWRRSTRPRGTTPSCWCARRRWPRWPPRAPGRRSRRGARAARPRRPTPDPRVRAVAAAGLGERGGTEGADLLAHLGRRRERRRRRRGARTRW